MKKIKVYDINSFVQANYPEYEAFRYEKVAVFEGPRGVVMAEEEAVQQRENRLSDTVVIPLCKKAVVEDGHRYVSIMAEAEMTISLEEIVSEVPFEEKTIEEFFHRRNYNPRCQDNYDCLMRNLREIGFDLHGYFEEKPSLNNQVSEAAKRVVEPQTDDKETIEIER